ncbi:16S rRNA (adenine(1518)-N(6)/adenine(1519)-N(6))-dimethyltransferase RsmA [Maridesulfovibrio hydrothermalis]|uniref:Ribosomal RNA small subunit methyltransferase A n=1 Tax=Maridesulfovibrio hydrothermalis AM13 = DSM 14728 TaxID=1121451 RepID=L0RDK7_9BACT|nr:16S rRNA (adenine(1518)-N(6)/adenine(1519)-N(6))-dimethyltransferase RsmA [Maridesulfovibrio hydrothermalis]CCO24285.1 Ribosomal RNA small subunit methyltransferase A [Maridesulfovibrio hydrothermalis AM13 = DSM 14728]
MQIRHRAKKSLGQNFLQDANIARKIVDSLRITENDCIIEIGPGQGALTRHIIEASPERVMLIEKDRDLAPALEAEFPEVEVIQEDALKFNWEDLDPAKNWKIIGNLPYNVASKIMWDVAAQSNATCVFMVQHEVGLRITADPGSKKYGGISVWIQSFCRTEYIFKVPPTVFKPMPKVDSAVIKFFPRPAEEKPIDIKGLAKLIKYCFQYRRKQLGKILKSFMSDCVVEWAEKEGRTLKDRPEALSPLQFQSLYKCVKNDFPS